MATLKEQEQLIEVLKFTPRTYKISMWGYGGEKVMGTVSREVWDYCNENQVELSDIAWNDEETVTEDMGLDIDKLPFPPGSWYECDDMAHVNGVSKDAGTLQIEDENGNTVVEKSFDEFDGCSDDSPEWTCGDEAWIGSRSKGEIVFIGNSNEKGTFFEGDIELKAPFDITKLTLQYDEIDGEDIINTVLYDGEEIENYGGSTDGKSSDFTMVEVIDDEGNWERYSPEEKDWGHPPIGTSPSDWESSPKFKFKQHKPVHPGYYSVNWGYGSTYGSLYWDGENFGDWEYGKFNPVTQEGVVTWQGYNWDTSSWVNQPPEPPNIICKKCKHTGDSDKMERNDDYDIVCPECGSTKTEWIDYDPETAKGRKNREKYCKPWDPALALEQIPVPEGNYDVKGEFGVDVECVQCDWKGSVDELYYEDEFADGVCPECKQPVEVIKENNMAWPFGPDDDTPTPFPGSSEPKEKKELTAWTVSTYYKKSIEEVEHFTKDGMEIIHRTGWRSGSWTVYTNDGNPPEFEFDYVPGGDGKKDSIDINNCYGNNIEEVELVETFDGCWDDIEWPNEIDEDEQSSIEEAMEDEGYYTALEENDWWQSDTEMWIWGPIVIEGENNYRRIICADENGNVIDFNEE